MQASTFQAITFDDITLYRHSGEHIAHSDLEAIVQVQHWQLQKGQRWGLIGGAEHQRAALIQAIREKLDADAKAQRTQVYAEISMAEQERLIAAEQKRNQTGVADEIYAGTAVTELLASHLDKPLFTPMVEQLGFEQCLNKHFRDLSSGETRRLMLLRALLAEPAVLLMHDPLEGLDRETRPVAQSILDTTLQQASTCLAVFAASRAEQLPAHCTHLAIIEDLALHCVELNADNPLDKAIASWQAHHSVSHFLVPALPADHPFHAEQLADPSAALVRMHKVRVHYASSDSTVIDALDWTVMPNQHWRITGANGSGKTTLLKLITGDHPQVYNNDIQVCGFQRGSGESVWQVKRHIGYMGGEMLWDYRGASHAGKALDVVISGLYDSIGLYTAPNAADKAAAEQWLALIGITNPRQRFKNLGMAEQRLVLIARAMIKRPALLILDEPLQGLDGPDRQRVLAIVSSLLSANAVTLLYVSHHDDEQVPGISQELVL